VPGRGVTSRARAVRLGGFRISFFCSKTRPDTSRLHGRTGLTTSVCQAKDEKCLRNRKYSAEAKSELPQIKSLFGPGLRHSTEPGRECWQTPKRDVFRKSVFYGPECFFRQISKI